MCVIFSPHRWAVAPREESGDEDDDSDEEEEEDAAPAPAPAVKVCILGFLSKEISHTFPLK